MQTLIQSTCQDKGLADPLPPIKRRLPLRRAGIVPFRLSIERCATQKGQGDRRQVDL